MPQHQSLEPEDVTRSRLTPIRNFLIGALLSGIPIFAYGSLSVDMAYGSVADLGTSQLVVAIAVPLLCGVLSAAFGKKVIHFLGNLLESTTLPF